MHNQHNNQSGLYKNRFYVDLFVYMFINYLD